MIERNDKPGVPSPGKGNNETREPETSIISRFEEERTFDYCNWRELYRYYPGITGEAAL